MNMLNVVPVASIVLSCTMISLPINSAEGRGSVQGGGGGGVVGIAGGGGRGGGGIASRGGAIASRGGFVGNRGAVVGSRAAVAGSRGVIAGNRGAIIGSRGAVIGNPALNRSAVVGNPGIGNRGTFSTAAAPGGRVEVRRAQSVVPAAAGLVGAQAVSSQRAFANQGFESDRRFDRRSDWRSDRRFDRRFDRRHGNRFDRRAIPLYYYGFNFYPSYGFDINDYIPVTVDENGRPFDRRFVRSDNAVRVPGAILPVAGAPRTVEVQLALRNRGFYGGPIDGIIGSQTRGAIRAFQYAYGLPVNGGIDSRMFTVLMRGF